MILSVGTDLIETARLERLYQNHGREKLLKVFSTEELDYALPAKNRGQRLALRFAVKEACFKAFSLAGIGSFPYHNFVYLKNAVALRGKAASACPQGLSIHVSVAHTDKDALAFVVLEQKKSAL